MSSSAFTSPTSGEILLHGEPVAISSPRDALDRGIGMVHQHFMLIPVMTVAENIVLAASRAEVRSSTPEKPRRRWPTSRAASAWTSIPRRAYGTSRSASSSASRS